MITTSRKRGGRTGNRLLDRLSPADLNLLARKFEVLHLPAREVLFHLNEDLEDVYFPTTAVFSLVVTLNPEEGEGLEIATVGNEGIVGFTALLGVRKSLHQAICQVPGDCLRLPAPALAKAMVRRPGIDRLVKRYAAVAYHAVIQSVVCNALHPVEQRVCRWLLVTHEKVVGEFPATQDYLAASLGVKRPTISVVANSLLKAGLITYHRGTIRILDRRRLEQFACPCFMVAKAAYRRIIDE